MLGWFLVLLIANTFWNTWFYPWQLFNISKSNFNALVRTLLKCTWIIYYSFTRGADGLQVFLHRPNVWTQRPLVQTVNCRKKVFTRGYSSQWQKRYQKSPLKMWGNRVWFLIEHCLSKDLRARSSESDGWKHGQFLCQSYTNAGSLLSFAHSREMLVPDLAAVDHKEGKSVYQASSKILSSTRIDNILSGHSSQNIWKNKTNIYWHLTTWIYILPEFCGYQ